jgi:transcription initiation factor TFIID TATA-box-binding protein
MSTQGIADLFAETFGDIFEDHSMNDLCHDNGDAQGAQEDVVPVMDEPWDEILKSGTDRPMPEVVINNVVCSSRVNCQLDLDHCNKCLPNASRDKKRFPALFVRLKKPAVTLLLFTNGKVVATGGKSYQEDVRAMRKLVKSLHKNGYTEAKLAPVAVQNIVAKVNMGFPIQISKLARDPLHKRFCEPQGRDFTCITYNHLMPNRKITVRIFGKGGVTFQSATR